MKYFFVPHISSAAANSQREMDDEKQKEQVRLALKSGFDKGDPVITLRKKVDDSDSDNDAERAFADEIHDLAGMEAGAELAGSKRADNSKPKRKTSEDCTIIAIGDGAPFALESLSELAKFASVPLSQRIYTPFVQLLLVAPRVSSREFVETADALARGALVSRVCRRIVVLYTDAASPGAINATLNGRLGLWGPSGNCFSNVLALDTSSLVLGHLPGINAYLASLEVLGLIGRAAHGASDGTLRRMAARGAVIETGKT